MNLVKPGYEIISELPENPVEFLKVIERAARVCYKSEGLIKDDGSSAEKLVRGLIKSNHTAMLEHQSLSVIFTVDRGVSHELVRHRLASFAQESTRYCSYNGDKFGNQISVIDISGGLGLDPKATNMDHEKFQLILDIWEEAMIRAEDSYMKLLNVGCSPQIARGVLPQSLKTEIVVTANLREWRHILSLRACDATGPAHPQIKEVMVPLLKELHSKIPVVFDDLYELLPKAE